MDEERIVQRVAQAVVAAKLSRRHMELLDAVYRHQDIPWIAKLMDTSASGVSRMLAVLERNGLASRYGSEAHLTAEGTKLLFELWRSGKLDFLDDG